MGEVYRARDSRLGRDVAIKVLPERLAADPDALARFEREARAVAALSHPHIVALFDIGRDGEVAYLVMELLAGESLAARVARGAMPLSEAVAIAVQVAEALAAAHRQGVVHRDLKPANVMLTKTGVRLLDFGLAKRRGIASAAGSDDWTHLPTAVGDPTPLTAEGSLLGTLQYMAPEQLEGKEADARSDLFAFGAMLYEMLSGQRAFPGATPASVIAAILKGEPRPLGELQPLTPPALERLVRRCLAKDPEERWQSAADVAEALRWIQPASGVSGPWPGAAVSGSSASGGIAARRWRSAGWGWVVAAVLALAASGLAVRQARTASGLPPLQVSLPPPPTGLAESYDSVELSPDGRQVAFIAGNNMVGGEALWVRRLDAAEPRQLPGTEHARDPFWSPDSRALGFFADGKLKTVAVAGGPPAVLAAVQNEWGGSWGSRGEITFAPGDASGISAISELGGAVRELTRRASDEEGHRWPCFLPDGEHFLFLADSSLTEAHRIRLGSLQGGATLILTQAISNPRFAAPDRLLYVRAGSLLVQRFDATKGLIGSPTALAEHLMPNGDNHHFEFSVAPGLLTYRTLDPTSRFVWVDRRDLRREAVGQPGIYDEHALSRDQRRLAYIHLDADGRREGLWWRDLERGIDARLVRGADPDVNTVDRVVWSPDGNEIAYSISLSGPFRAVVGRLANPAERREILGNGDSEQPRAWSPDGRWIIVQRDDADGGFRLMVAAASGRVEAMPWKWGAGADAPAFSPDGRWLAYSAEPSEHSEVFVAPFEGSGTPVQVSVGGGANPSWRGDGRELYYVSRANRLTAVSIDVQSGTVVPGVPEPLLAMNAGVHPLDGSMAPIPSPDGQRFLLLERAENPELAPQRLVVGWEPP